jgi:hypothetical protein
MDQWLHHFTEYDLRSGAYLHIDMDTVTTSVQQTAHFSVYNQNPLDLPVAITKSQLSSSSCKLA